MRLGSGVVADRTKRYKDVAALGYGTSAVCKGALLVVGGSVGGLSLVVLADRLGKGIRTAPRDALISLSSTRDRLATSFGVHRAMDTAGAMLGPLVAFGLLLAAPRVQRRLRGEPLLRDRRARRAGAVRAEPHRLAAGLHGAAPLGAQRRPAARRPPLPPS